MLVSDIVGPVEVCVETVAALAAEEEGLRTTIVTSLVPTTRTGLGCVTRIDFDDLHAMCLSFVAQKAVELAEAPAMEASLPLALSHLSAFTDVAQVLNDESCTRLCVLNNALGEDVVMVFSLPKQFARKLLQVPFGRFASLFLKLAAKAENAAFLLFPPPLPQEAAIAGYSRPIETQVHANHFLGGRAFGSRNGHNDVEEIAALTETQISTTDLATNILLSMVGNAERAFHTPSYCSKAGGGGLPLHPVGSSVIPDTSECTLWATNRLKARKRLALLLGFSYLLWVCLFLFLLPCESRFDGFSGFHTSGTHQLSRKIGERCTQWVVGLFMQFDAIAALFSKAETGHLVEASRMFLKRSFEDAGLLWRWVQLCHNRSIHTKLYHIYGN